jgi:hypothetical protein
MLVEEKRKFDWEASVFPITVVVVFLVVTFWMVFDTLP